MKKLRMTCCISCFVILVSITAQGQKATGKNESNVFGRLNPSPEKEFKFGIALNQKGSAFKTGSERFETPFKEKFKNFDRNFIMKKEGASGYWTTITEEQRKYAMADLKRTKGFFEKETIGLSDEQLQFKSTPDKWSIDQIVEHIALAESGIFQIIQGSLKVPADSAKRKEIKVTDKEIAKRLTNRSFKAESPESIKPTGKFPSTQDAVQAFSARRNATIEYINTTTDDLLNHFWKHPATGTIDLFQTILLLSAHCERHILQIVEVKSSKGYPAK